MRIKLIRLEELTWLVALKKCKPNTGCLAEKVPNEHDSFSQCIAILISKINNAQLFIDDINYYLCV